MHENIFDPLRRANKRYAKHKRSHVYASRYEPFKRFVKILKSETFLSEKTWFEHKLPCMSDLRMQQDKNQTFLNQSKEKQSFLKI